MSETFWGVTSPANSFLRFWNTDNRNYNFFRPLWSTPPSSFYFLGVAEACSILVMRLGSCFRSFSLLCITSLLFSFRFLFFLGGGVLFLYVASHFLKQLKSWMHPSSKIGVIMGLYNFALIFKWVATSIPEFLKLPSNLSISLNLKKKHGCLAV